MQTYQLLLISFRIGWNGRKISCQSLSRYKSPPCSTSDWISAHSGLFQPFQPVSLNFSRYINSERYWKEHTFLRFKRFLLNEMILWQQSPRHWFLEGTYFLTASSFSFFLLLLLHFCVLCFFSSSFSVLCV